MCSINELIFLMDYRYTINKVITIKYKRIEYRYRYRPLYNYLHYIKLSKTFHSKKILMLIVCIHMSFTCSFVNDITNSCLLFFMDLSVMVSLLLLMSLIWNVRILCFM